MMVDIEVPEETVTQMVKLGFAILVEHPVAGEQVAMLTPSGEKWLRVYCDYMLKDES